jgi:arsenite methyltransferase
MVIANRHGAYDSLLKPKTPGNTERPGGIALTERALAQCQLPQQALVVDIGCGNATSVQHLATENGYLAVGVDACDTRLHTVHCQYPDTRLACGLGNQLPLPGGWVDGVLAECSISIMGHFQALFAEFGRILKSGGDLIASDLYARNPQGISMLRSLRGDCYLKNILTQAELFELLGQCGFAIRLWEDHSDQLNGFTMQWAMTFCSASNSKASKSSPVEEPDALDLQLAISKARIGYYLLVAQKYDG